MQTKIPNIDKLIEDALASYSGRSAEILSERYGLKSGKPKTLAELGEVYDITRERVRQIEAAALESLREKIIDTIEAKLFLELVTDYLDNVGRIRRSDLLTKDLMLLWQTKHPENVFSSRLNFLAEILGEPYVSYGDRDWHSVWYSDEKIYETAKRVAAELMKTRTHDFDEFLETVSSKFRLPTFLVVNYVTISKDFGVGPYGDLGATHWIHVNPKNVRDKIYLVLKRSQEPMHFKEVATLVNKLAKKRKAHHGTVHNELIKDPRFVWVKRGTYGLKEHVKR